MSQNRYNCISFCFFTIPFLSSLSGLLLASSQQQFQKGTAVKKRVIKLIVCIMLISALMIGFCSAYASAATPVWLLRAKAGIAAAMLASNLIIEPINAALDDSLLEGVDPVGYVETIQETPWTDYIDRSVITVRPDVVTIDGVPYSEIWLGPDAANSLRLSGLDFASAYNILTNQSAPITYADGLGNYFGVPVYNVNGFARSQKFTWYDSAISFSDRLSATSVRYSNVTDNSLLLDGNSHGSWQSPPTYSDVYWESTSSGGTMMNRCTTGLNGQVSKSNTWETYTRSAFSFDYVSGNFEEVPDPEDGLLLTVPTSYNDGESGSVFNYDIHDLINIFPQVDDTQGHELIFDPALNPDFDVDLDMGNALGDIITAVILAKLADLLGDNADVIYAPFPEKEDPGPVDPDLPDPEVPIGDQDPIWMDDLLRWIKNAIDNLGDRINDAIDTIHEDIQEIISQISELADKILEDIELGPAKLFDKALDILKTLFLPLLLPIRAMMNLWHYVVEWISSINTPFTWIFGIMSGTSGNMVLPIYALLAGGICISIYKALGR